MKEIITTEWTRYAGDHDNILYLDIGIAGNIQLCLQQDYGSAICMHLTSTDDEYKLWLYNHIKSLLLIDEKNWYTNPKIHMGGRYHFEFWRILHNLNDLRIK
jgi:hypothetical protein